MERTVTMPLGVIVERREIDHPWQKCIWRPVAVMPGTAPVDDWTELARGRGFVRFFCGTLPLSLHRGETEAYRYTLANTPPPVYVVLRSADAREDGREIRPFLVTASPYEAEDFLDSGDEIVEAVPMPEGVIAWVQDFIDLHHVDVPFVKRKRKPASAASGGPGEPPGRSRRAEGGRRDG